MKVFTQVDPRAGAGILPTRVGGGALTVPAGGSIQVEWADPVGLSVIRVDPGCELQVQLNASGVANETYFARVTGEQPLINGLVRIARYWLYNPGAAAVVLDGAGKNASCYGWI